MEARLNIKPIETTYKGCRFRSRLEARWAVFFDALGVNWEYEAQGFDLGEAGWYLPDFFFPDMCWFGEVKPDRYYSDGDALKMKTFDDHPPCGSMGLIHLIGTPEMHTGGLCGHPSRDSVWHFCGRAGLFKRDVIQRAVDAARSARFDGSDSVVHLCKWDIFADGDGDSCVVAQCGYSGRLIGEFPEKPDYCPKCGGTITNNDDDTPF